MSMCSLSFGISSISKVGPSYYQNVKTADEYYDAIDTGSEANAPRQSAVAKPAPAMPRQQTRLAVE